MRSPEAPHAPVMVDAVVGLLGSRGTVVDMTVGAGGHAAALLGAGVERVLGFDRDPEAVALARDALGRFGSHAELSRARFTEVEIAERVDGVLFDLGVSSMQLDASARGFGYRREGPLDMRMDKEGPSARDLVNEASEEELARIIQGFGEEHRARRVARAIVRARLRSPIETTDELARVVAGALGKRPGGPHPARRTFQALRIAVNRELEELAASLPRAVGFLAPGGRVVVIAYHSLEDRIVKRFLREDERLFVLTKKPLRPEAAEVAGNPRARSARLRAAERFEGEA
ncbi:MAG TPA: 16S rRNA (cytosine(1402)-N(4))-methyltransferase RsmH [Actinomycetota bacterium]|nr:16S rRNA (cytosine(1402)-N(4))-methyltransferase RsmH [Actinomycetota bacterium]